MAPELTGTVSALYEETVARLESSLQTVCADFQPDPYAKVHPPLHALKSAPQLDLHVWAQKLSRVIQQWPHLRCGVLLLLWLKTESIPGLGTGKMITS